MASIFRLSRSVKTFSGVSSGFGFRRSTASWAALTVSRPASWTAEANGPSPASVPEADDTMTVPSGRIFRSLICRTSPRSGNGTANSCRALTVPKSGPYAPMRTEEACTTAGRSPLPRVAHTAKVLPDLSRCSAKLS